MSIVEQLRQHLQSHGHDAGEVARLLDGPPFESPVGIPPIMQLAQLYLGSHGHRCAAIHGTAPHWLYWCGQLDECEDVATQRAMDGEQKAVILRAALLSKAGHRCIEYQESSPVQLRWCGKKDCVEAVAPAKTRVMRRDWRRQPLARACKTRRDYSK